MCLNLVYTKSAVLYADLFDSERVRFVASFNDPDDSFLVLIIMHFISFQGVNLDASCNQILVIINAVNAPFK